MTIPADEPYTLILADGTVETFATYGEMGEALEAEYPTTWQAVLSTSVLAGFLG